MRDAQLSEQMLSATISMTTVEGQKASLHTLPKEEARKIYQQAQKMEEKMIQRRRELELEKERAGAANINTKK